MRSSPVNHTPGRRARSAHRWPALCPGEIRQKTTAAIFRQYLPVLMALGLWTIAGCQQDSPTRSVRTVRTTASGPLFAAGDPVVSISARRQWTDSGIDVAAGQPLTIVADGQAEVSQSGLVHRSSLVVGPEGTYLYPDDALECRFPLPAAASGPAPCYCLIGRIGDGPPIYVGRHTSISAPLSGRLWLGINDASLDDNSGGFRAVISQPEQIQPMGYREHQAPGPVSGGPVPGASVVVFYVDGLRPDVVREMAAMGHIPHINRLFVEGGCSMVNTFTAFPSDTITSNGTMWTGCFSDRHGIKGQVRFSRRTLHSESYLEPLGPHRSASVLAPQGIDGLVHQVRTRAIEAGQGEAAAKRFDGSRRTGVDPVFERLRNNGSDWATGALPMMADSPPPLWTRSLMRRLPYLQGHRAWEYIDDANTDFAIGHLFHRERPVTVVWLPETDSVSHKQQRGQFGATRRTIARADRMIGDMVAEIAEQGRLHSTYLMLVSDHGHHGGQMSHLDNYDLANDLFYSPRRIDADGQWRGGGLGLSVRQHRFWNRHPGDGSKEFVFIDGDSDGAARIFLPRRHYRSGEWYARTRPADLLGYRVDGNRPPVNLIAALTSAVGQRGNGMTGPPVDLVLAKLTEHSILISTADRGQAVIKRRRTDENTWAYRYFPVTNVRPSGDGSILYDELADPVVDPLRLLEHFSPELCDNFHDERTWLQLTALTAYPDGVVTLTRHMLWQEHLRYREAEFAPDLVVTARAGWYFGTHSSPGTMHGYPLPDAMRASWFISGPNIRRGAVIEEPMRLADLTPTMLEMVGHACDPTEFDGRAARMIYQDPAGSDSLMQPVFWQDFDLQAWQPLRYCPPRPNPYLPRSVNRPNHFADLNNLGYDVVTLSDIPVLSILDDVVSPLAGRGNLEAALMTVDRQLRNSRFEPLGEAVTALNVTGVALGDFSNTSQGNMQRVSGAVDWTQSRIGEVDRLLARPWGRSSLPGMQFAGELVDHVQAGFWETYQFGQRVGLKVLDEILLNGTENTIDHLLNAFDRPPAELPWDPPGTPRE